MLLTCSVFIADAVKCSVNVVQRSVISVECNTRTLSNKKASNLQKTKREAAVPGNSPGGYHTEVLNHIWYGSVQHNSLAVCQTGSVSLNLWRCLGIQRPSTLMINRLLIYYIKCSAALTASFLTICCNRQSVKNVKAVAAECRTPYACWKSEFMPFILVVLLDLFMNSTVKNFTYYWPTTCKWILLLSLFFQSWGNTFSLKP